MLSGRYGNYCSSYSLHILDFIVLSLTIPGFTEEYLFPNSNRMPKSKAEKAKKQEKPPNGIDTPPLEPVDEAELTSEPAKDAENGDKSFSKVLSEIQKINITMTERFDGLEASLATAQASLMSICGRLQEVENASSDHNHCLSLVEKTCLKLQADNEALRLKVLDLEGRSRWQNFKIVGLPEKIENGLMVEFLFFPKLLGADNFDKPLDIDRAHRLGGRTPGERDHPRVTIAWIHSVQVREKILQLAREQFPLNYNGKAIHIFPDIPTEVVKQRQVFQGVRKRLMDAGARCSFYYPARLRVTHGSMVKVFSTPREAEEFLGTIQEGSD
uniref:L1 transposable element RRM domain-containing protein n=1 Tax=Pundamilia nyererei TaxID=303518 RepID=A0A3B4ERM7_9CICH